MPADDLSRIGVALASSLTERLYEIQAKEYPTESATKLVKAVESLIELVRDALVAAEDEAIKRFACEALRFIGETLNYLETANSATVPGALIPPVETLVKTIFPGANVLLRVQWEYNYEVFEICDYYRRALGRLLDHDALSNALDPLNGFFVVSLPIIERSNVLLHAILGHELGHRLATQFLEEDEDNLVASAEAQAGDLEWYVPTFASYPAEVQFRIRQEAYEAIIEAKRRTLEELISDLVGVELFGLSALLATYSLAAVDALDAPPEKEYGYYPPWRYRIREIVRAAESKGILHAIDALVGEPPMTLVRDSAREKLETIRGIIADESDKAAIAIDEVVRRAYEDLPPTLERAAVFVSEKLNHVSYRSDVFSKEVPPLLARLALGVPPDSVDANPPDFRSAVAAGWLYRGACSSLPYGEEWKAEHDEWLNRLVAKAVESIQIQGEYSTWLENDALKG